MSELNKRIPLTLSKACDVVEGMVEASQEDITESWAFLIETGHCWTLQGWFGRTAMDYIKFGLISEEGEINWEAL